MTPLSPDGDELGCWHPVPRHSENGGTSHPDSDESSDSSAAGAMLGPGRSNCQVSYCLSP